MRRSATVSRGQRGGAIFVSTDRKPVLLRFDPAVRDALVRWASDEFRSFKAQIELLLRRALSDARRMPKRAAPLPQRGRPRITHEQRTGTR